MQNFPGLRFGQVSVFVFELTVDEDILDSYRELRWVLIGGAIANGCGIENRDIGKEVLPQ
jgi:hypothetical protein